MGYTTETATADNPACGESSAIADCPRNRFVVGAASKGDIVSDPICDPLQGFYAAGAICARSADLQIQELNAKRGKGRAHARPFPLGVGFCHSRQVLPALPVAERSVDTSTAE
jgi:hypothetical protein